MGVLSHTQLLDDWNLHAHWDRLTTLLPVDPHLQRLRDPLLVAEVEVSRQALEVPFGAEAGHRPRDRDKDTAVTQRATVERVSVRELRRLEHSLYTQAHALT